VNDFLIWVGDSVASLWSALASASSWGWHFIDGVLNPVLSPVLGIIDVLTSLIGDAVFAVLSPLPPWVSLTILSSVCGVVMLFAFKYLSNQKAIARVKDDIQANLLALKLYKDELRVTLVSQVRLLWAVARLQRYVLTPVLVTLPVMLLLLGQIGVRYQWRPLEVGEQTIVRATFQPESGAADIRLDVDEGISIDAGPVASQSDVVWRVHAMREGIHTARVTAGDTTIEKTITAGSPGQRVSPMRPGNDWTSQILYPIEPPLPAPCPLASIQIDYPTVDGWYSGSDYWILTFLVVSMVAALIFKPAVGVRF